MGVLGRRRGQAVVVEGAALDDAQFAHAGNGAKRRRAEKPEDSSPETDVPEPNRHLPHVQLRLLLCGFFVSLKHHQREGMSKIL